MNRRIKRSDFGRRRTLASSCAAALAAFAIATGCALAAPESAKNSQSPSGGAGQAAQKSRTAGATASTGRTRVEMRDGIVGALRAGVPQQLAPGQAVTAGMSIVGFERVVEDSRCPKGTTCVWAGRARVAISLRKSPSAPESVQELEVGSPEKGAMKVGDMQVVAKALAPYPEAKIPIAAGDYRLELVLAETTAKAKR